MKNDESHLAFLAGCDYTLSHRSGNIENTAYFKIRGGRDMVKLYDSGVYLVNGTEVVADNQDAEAILKSKMGDGVPSKAEAAKNTIADNILRDHNTSCNMAKLKIKFQNGILKLKNLKTKFLFT